MTVPPPASRAPVWRLAAVAVLVTAAAVAMLMTSGQMADLRVAVPPLSHLLSRLDTVPVPLDLYHVVFFALLGLALRLLLPRAHWGWLLLGLGALAAATELLQFGTIGRTPRLVDLRDDLIGAAAGLLAGGATLRCAACAAGVVRAGVSCGARAWSRRRSGRRP